MRRVLFAFPLAGAALSAAAADLPARPYAPPAPFFTWTGFYEGLFAGTGAIDNAPRPVCFAPNGVPNGPGCALRGTLRPQTDDFVAGSELGYYRQLAPGSGVVVGAAIDYAFTRIRGYQAQVGAFPTVGGGAVPGIAHAGQRLDGLGTARLKLGYAFDRVLVYATAGAAAGNVRIDSNLTLGGLPFDARRGEVRLGYAAGGGVEYAFSQRLSSKVEALYYDLGSRTALGGDAFGLSGFRYGSRVDTAGYQVRVGINDRFGDGLPLIGLIDEFRHPAPDTELPASIWTFETGGRVFASTGSHRDTLAAAPGPVGQRLAYRGYDALAGESFGRLDHNPTGLFLKGFLGSGTVTREGRLNAQGVAPASTTVSPIRDGDVAYAVIDAGYDALRTDAYRLGAFVGFQYDAEFINADGCTRAAGAGGVVCPGPVPTPVKVATEDAHWYGLRVGVAGSARFDRLKLSLEGAYLPVVELTGNDRRWLRPDLNPLPQRGGGDGYFLEGVATYDLSSRLSVGVGARYWRLSAAGRTQFPTLPSPSRFDTERYGAFAQFSYKIADIGLTPLITK